MDGNVIGCLSACMAGINAQDPSVNCCSGKYNSMEACYSEEVDFYKQVILSVLLAWNHLSQVGLLSRVLKPYCQNAYWYRESPCDLSTCPLMLGRYSLRLSAKHPDRRLGLSRVKERCIHDHVLSRRCDDQERQHDQSWRSYFCRRRYGAREKHDGRWKANGEGHSSRDRGEELHHERRFDEIIEF